MSARELVQLMSILLSGVALVIVMLSWQAFGIALERYTWPHRLYRLVTLVVLVLVAGSVIWYLREPGRAMADLRRLLY